MKFVAKANMLVISVTFRTSKSTLWLNELALWNMWPMLVVEEVLSVSG